MNQSGQQYGDFLFTDFSRSYQIFANSEINRNNHLIEINIVFDRLSKCIKIYDN